MGEAEGFELLLAGASDFEALDRLYHEHLAFLARWNATIDVHSTLDSQWFCKPDLLFPWMFRLEGELAGIGLMGNHRLAMAMGSDADYYLHEFHVRAPFRRRGVGRAAVDRLRAEHPGSWCVDVLPANTLAMDFWSALLRPLGATVTPFAHDDGIEYARFRTGGAET